MLHKAGHIVIALSLLALLAAVILTVHFGTYAITPPAGAEKTDRSRDEKRVDNSNDDASRYPGPALSHAPSLPGTQADGNR